MKLVTRALGIFHLRVVRWAFDVFDFDFFFVCVRGCLCLFSSLLLVWLCSHDMRWRWRLDKGGGRRREEGWEGYEMRLEEGRGRGNGRGEWRTLERRERGWERGLEDT